MVVKSNTLQFWTRVTWSTIKVIALLIQTTLWVIKLAQLQPLNGLANLVGASMTS